jgi:hypothetical protein
MPTITIPADSFRPRAWAVLVLIFPSLILPSSLSQNNYVYPAEQKNLNFSWTPPLGNLAGSLIEYDQVVVKVQAGQNPNDAIAAARDFKAGNPKLDKKGRCHKPILRSLMIFPLNRARMPCR